MIGRIAPSLRRGVDDVATPPGGAGIAPTLAAERWSYPLGWSGDPR
ncbi:MAG: hypothetical protein AAF657_37025 [Acidobacteriota bacterium]